MMVAGVFRAVKTSRDWARYKTKDTLGTSISPALYVLSAEEEEERNAASEQEEQKAAAANGNSRRRKEKTFVNIIELFLLAVSLSMDAFPCPFAAVCPSRRNTGCGKP